MPPKKKVHLNQLLSFLIEAAVGLAILALMWLAVVNLPMLEGISLPLQFTLAELLGAILLLAIAAALLAFTLRLKYHLGHLAPIHQKSIVLIKQLILPLFVLLIYLALRPLLVPYLGGLAWTFHLLFLAVFLALLVLLGHSLYRHTRQLIILYSNPAVRELLTTTLVSCEQCGEKNMADARFCSSCGEKLLRPGQCNSCGMVIDGASKFCPACGAPNSETGPTEASPAANCASCGVSLKPEAKYCHSCGAPVSAQESFREPFKVDQECSSTVG
ncbi:MAG TPA: zinc ribbon domain-containing protein [Bacillota bacterium]|nr:zinc ribbon domain-containing protein [Bacillota bacterium]